MRCYLVSPLSYALGGEATLHHPSGPVLNGFGYMVGSNCITVFQVGNGASQFQDAVEGPGREVKLFHGCLEETLGWFLYLAELSHLGGCHFGIAG